jgi:hypothetical protein
MTEQQQLRGRVRVYACGGTGINIAASLDGKQPKEDLAYAQLDITYIDTSKSNLLEKKLDQNRVYLVGDGLEEKDGAGKMRRTHFEDIKDCTGDILQRHEPGDLSVVISSLSGGSGSVIAPLIVSRLLKAGKPVIAIGIASLASKVEILNTLDTFQSYEGIITKLEMPITLAYYQNGTDTPRATVDAEVRGLIASLMMLYSRNNAELDSQDLKHWLRFDQNKSSYEPQLSALQVVYHANQSAIEGDVISIATLTAPDVDATLTTIPEYHCQGIVTKADGEVKKVLPRHYFITSNYFVRVHKTLQRLIEQFNQQSGSRTRRITMLTSDVDLDDSGMAGV